MVVVAGVGGGGDDGDDDGEVDLLANHRDIGIGI